MSDQPTPITEHSPDHRARVVAGIRALADLIETNTDLPVPDSVGAQHSISGDLDDDGRQLVRDAAAALGVEPRIKEYLATTRHVVAQNDWDTGQQYFYISYVVHGSRPEPSADAEAEAQAGEQA
jgi:hypothetical protein